MRVMAAVLLALGLVGVTSEARAQDASHRTGSHFIVGAERLFGFGYIVADASYSSTTGGVTATHTETLSSATVNLLSPAVTYGQNMFLGTTPRLALDYQFDNHLTVGGTLLFSYAHLNDDSSTTATVGGTTTTRTSSSEYDLVGVGIAPRVGYLLALGDSLALWIRAGVTVSYANLSQPDEVHGMTTTHTSINMTNFSLNLEPALVYFPIPRVGLTAGLIGDIALYGDNTTTERATTGSTTTTSETSTTFHPYIFGVQFGLSVWL